MKRNKGITLIALIITIIVLLILVAVSVQILIKSNLIGVADKATNKYKTASEEEASGGAIEINGKKYASVEDYPDNPVIEWDEVLKNAQKHPEQTIKQDVGLGTDGEVVNLDYWNYEIVDEYYDDEGNFVEGYVRIIPNQSGCISNNSYTGPIIDKTIIIPQYIKKEGTEKFIPVRILGPQMFGMARANTEIHELEINRIIIPSTVSKIEYGALETCSKVTSLTIPQSVINIDNGAFSLESLESINVEEGNVVYDSRENCNAIIETATNTLIYGSKNSIIPNSVTSIRWGAFCNCVGLTNITIPDSVTSIEAATFSGCTGLTSITIPNSVTSIEHAAFRGCTGLISITIPNSVTTIGNYAFEYCTGITSITIPNSVTNMGEAVFYEWMANQTINIEFSRTRDWNSGWSRSCNANIVWKTE